MFALALIGGLAWGAWKLLSNPVGDLAVALRSGDANRERPAPVYEPPRDFAEFVGSAACRECHADLCDSYARTAMGSSLSLDAATHPPESDSREHTFRVKPGAGVPGLLEYTVEYADSTMLHRERLLADDADDAAIIYEIAHPIACVVGSGTRGYSYLIARDGMLFQSPIGYYTGSDGWDLSPGYEGKNRSFRRKIVDGCIHCHAGRVAATPEREHHFQEPFAIEASIGCERCHGPGAGHIAHHRSGSAGLDPIVNPAGLTGTAREAICYQCHLAPEYRITHAGRSDYDFRPGNSLSSVWAMFVDHGVVEADGRPKAVNHVEQMRSSRCFTGSSGRLECLSCHDPHSSPTRENAAAFYRARCQACHAESSGTDCTLPIATRLERNENACASCHMPVQPADDVAHTSLADHRIPRVATTATRGLRAKPKLELFESFASELSASEIARARALVAVPEVVESRNRLRAESLQRDLETVLRAFPEDPRVLVALAQVCRIRLNALDAERYCRRALEVQPNNETALEELVMLYHETERWEEGVTRADRLLRLDPTNYNVWGRKAHMLGNLDRLPEGIAAARRAIELQPLESQIHDWLAEAYRVSGEAELSRKHRELHRATLPRQR